LPGTRRTGKAICIILDGVGVGALPDAGAYGDEGSNTLLHTAQAVGRVKLPALGSLGLGNIQPVPGVPAAEFPRASFGRMVQRSRGKDSTTGHWELAGCIVERPFPTYPNGFPQSLLERFLRVTDVGGYLGNVPASGTAIIQELGDEHVRTGFPIVYTSADSVFQIAAHEGVIPLARLYAICQKTREQVCVGDHGVGRVIARPFVGKSGSYTRTTNRRDFSLEPFGPTVLDLLAGEKISTVGIGKVDDLFARRGLSVTNHTRTNREGMASIREVSGTLRTGFVIANLGDFDTLYGHRNDPAGFAAALEDFDGWLMGFLETLTNEDLLLITADHGNDPVTPSTDHSREYVPVLAYNRGAVAGKPLGVRETFADCGKTVAEYFGVANNLAGTSFLADTL
jgi:phosphopentomutase